MNLLTSALSLTGLPQKILLGGLGAALVATTTYNVVQSIENHVLAGANLKLDKRINDPKTGYVVKLTQANTNSAICVAAITKQTTAIKSQSQHDAATISAVQARYDTEHAARVRAENSAAAVLARKPVGATLIDRVTDVDGRILETLK